MTYIPTKEELIELGFTVMEKSSNEGTELTAEYGGNQTLINQGYKLFMLFNGVISTKNIYFYPQSLEDIKTLIRILTPQ